MTLMAGTAIIMKTKRNRRNRIGFALLILVVIPGHEHKRASVLRVLRVALVFLVVVFSVFSGATQIGSSATSGTVVNGAASASYTLPAGTATGSYSIKVSFASTTDYGSSNNSADSPFPALTVGKAATSVVNRYCQSWDVHNLFVPGGASVFPQNHGYNPTDTVGALAYWAADAITGRYLKNPGPLV